MANPLVSLLLDPAKPDQDKILPKYRFTGDWRVWGVPAGLGAALVAISLVLGLGDSQRFMYGYLIAWTFCVSITIGALFFVMIQNVVRARWSVTIRRIPEAIAYSFPLLFVLGLPIVLHPFFSHDLYHWVDPALYTPGDHHYDTIMVGKAGYFFGWADATSHQPWFFLIRYFFYFGVFSLLSHKLYTLSVANDTDPTADRIKQMVFHSAWGIPVGAVCAAFVGFDYLMSLDPHWFSTIFGVYFFAGGWWANLALMAFISMALHRTGMLTHEITQEHVQDIGKMMFGFTVFWTYIAFSQYFLYWYANIPEEVIFSMVRGEANWQYVTWGLILCHFLIPFVVLLPRFTKRFWPVLGLMAGWFLVIHWYDHFWIALPTLIPHASAGAEHASALLLAAAGEAGHAAAEGAKAKAGKFAYTEAKFVLTDLTLWLGLAGLWIGAILFRFSRHAITPYTHPYFADSLRFENV